MKARSFIKPVVFFVCLIPFAAALYGVYSNSYEDPIETLLGESGEWTLRFLLVTLCVTPLQFLIKSPYVAKFRRMLGLFAFFYATVHLLVWVVLDQQIDVSEIVSAVLKRPFISFGVVSWCGLLLLAITSNRFSVRKLGPKWKKLHSWVYVLALLGTVHFIWQVKSNEIVEPAMYLGVLTILLSYRFSRLVKHS